MQKQINIQELISLVELPAPQLHGTFVQAYKQFNEWKKLVEKQRKILAKKYHPDKGGSVDKMQSVNNAIDILLKIELMPPRPRPQIIVRYASFSSTSATSTSGTYTHWTHMW